MTDVTEEMKLKLETRRIEMRENLINNAMGRRENILSKLMDPRRDVDKECGFPEFITSDLIDRMDERNGIASKILSVFPDNTWKTTPEVLENSDAEEETEFEAAFKALHKKLRIDNTPEEEDGDEIQLDEETSWFNDVDSSPIWDVLKRADRMSRKSVNGYSIVLLGFNDVESIEDLKTPVQRKEGLELIYMTPYEEKHCPVASWVEDPKSKMYNRPKTYNVTTTRGPEYDHSNTTSSTVEVHYSRVIHVCYNPQGSDLFSKGMLVRSFNDIHGLMKICGAAPEGYWKMAFTKLLLSTNPGITEEDVNVESLKEEIFKWENSLQSVMSLFGFQGESIAPEVTDPTSFFNMMTDVLSITQSIPKRILEKV